MNMDEIRRIQSILEQQIAPGSAKKQEGEDKVSFKETLETFANDVNRLQLNAEEATERLISGDVENIHQVMVAMNEADSSFRLMMEVRNKIIEAYREIMKMQV
ncbi:flagellar hook-basal body complex protein FliE [candidate division LCP-89 bacterium B3_LCP]|uniref:Flagellar hook-basal body complex protein FliE n=1 Tax=candidate division LCP-89 bacterium B3_LCP TaxID=2012998 RepID=A0A532V4V4_UNCL8|nr:MAG: flagellar hook-basal body complex protein FliE [candidate division LCP-89 bacterium B3_LCP]